MNSDKMIDYLVSIKDYTIICNDDKYKVLEQKMIDNDMKVYYVNLNNIFNKNEIIDILEKKYWYLDNKKKLWIFYNGQFIDFENKIYKI